MDVSEISIPFEEDEDKRGVIEWLEIRRNLTIALIVYERINFNFFLRSNGKIGCVRSKDEIGFDAFLCVLKSLAFESMWKIQRF